MRIENDANCFALAEARLGAGRPFRDGVVFGVVAATLAVANQHVLDVELAQERARDLAGVGTVVELAEVLCAEAQLKLFGVQQQLNRTNVGEWREDSNLGVGVVVAGILEAPSQLLH